MTSCENIKPDKYVFLTDAQQRKTLAAMRSLGKKGIGVLAAEETRWATSLFSRYCTHGLVNPDPVKDPEKYVCWLSRHLEKYDCKVLFPMDDNTMNIAVKYRKRLEKFSLIPVPGQESYTIASDKYLATMMAKEVGLNCPVSIAPKNLEDIELAMSDLRFPVIIKPRKSSGSRGMKVVYKPEDLAEQYRKVHHRYPFPFIQEYIKQGEKYDVCLLFNRSSHRKAFFVQKELRCFPIEKGPSTVQESVWRPDLVEMAEKLLVKLNWQGVAEVEFMVNPDNGEAVFLEINPRFWGSLHAAIVSGVDFPWLLYRLAVDGDVEPVNHYNVGVRCRWLLPGDCLHFLFNKNRFRMNPPFFSTRKSRLNDDILSMDDPLPVLGFFLACIRYALSPTMWKKVFFDRF